MYIQDSTANFTINFIALEGFGNIIGIDVFNLTLDPSEYNPYTYFPATGWDPSQPAIAAGQSVRVYAWIANTGEGDDTLFVDFVSTVIPIEAVRQESMVLVGGEFPGSWSFTMPASNVNITISAGHVE